MTLVMVTVALALVGLACGEAARRRLRRDVERGGTGAGVTGAAVARRMLSLGDSLAVVARTEGETHFDVDSSRLLLAGPVYSGTGPQSIALACHEAGHALQVGSRPWLPGALSAACTVRRIAIAVWAVCAVGALAMGGGFLAAASVAAWLAGFAAGVVACAAEGGASKRALGFLRSLTDVPAEALSQVRRTLALSFATHALASLV